MGNLIFWNYQELNKDLRDKAIEILEEKKQEIIKFFNSKGTFEKPIGNDYTQNPDKALEKIFYPNENKHKLYLKIYNIPGIFRNNDGLFEIIGETLMIFQLFFNKYQYLDDKEQYKKKFDKFFDALIQADSKKINELIQLDIKESDLIKKKKGLEYLMEIFGDEDVKSYYEYTFKVCAGLEATLVGGTVVSIITGQAIRLGPTIGAVVVILISGYFLYKYFQNKNYEKTKNNIYRIQDFCNKIESFLSNGIEFFCQDGEKNLFVIAYEKDNNNSIKELCMFPYYIGGLRGNTCPTIGNSANPNSNADYYRTILDACKYYVDEYSSKIYQHLNGNPQPNLQNEIEQDFQFLKNATTEEVKQKIYAYNEIQKFKTSQRLYEASTAFVSKNVSFQSNQNYQEFQENDYQQAYQQDQNKILLQSEYN